MSSVSVRSKPAGVVGRFQPHCHVCVFSAGVVCCFWADGRVSTGRRNGACNSMRSNSIKMGGERHVVLMWHNELLGEYSLTWTLQGVLAFLCMLSDCTDCILCRMCLPNIEEINILCRTLMRTLTIALSTQGLTLDVLFFLYLNHLIFNRFTTLCNWRVREGPRVR